MITINLLAVLGAAIAAMIIGMIWYSPSVFGKKLMLYVGQTAESMAVSGAKKSMAKNYAINFLGSLVTAYVLAYFIKLLGVTDATGALILTLWVWLGFIATAALGSVLWENKPWGYYFLNTVYRLVSLYAMSLILTFWI